MSNPYDDMHLYNSNNYIGSYTDYNASITPKLDKSQSTRPTESVGNKYPKYVNDVYDYLDKYIMDSGKSSEVEEKFTNPNRNGNNAFIELTKKLEYFQQKNTFLLVFIVVLIFYIICKPDYGYMNYHSGYMGYPPYPMIHPMYQVPMMPMAPMQKPA